MNEIKYDKKELEFKKASMLIHSEIFQIEKRKEKYYKLSPIQFDIFNYLLYNAKEQLIRIFKSEKELIELTNKLSYDDFEKLVDVTWFEISRDELSMIINKSTVKKKSHLLIELIELENVKMRINIVDKDAETNYVFNLLRKISYESNSKKIKYKLEPELFLLTYYLKPFSNYTFTMLKLKEQFKLSTTASKKLYEFLKDWLFVGKVIIDFDKLLKIMNIDITKKSNKKFGSFNRNHLKKIIKEINEKTDMYVEYNKKIKNEKISVEFILSKNKNNKTEDKPNELDIIDIKLKAKSKNKLEHLKSQGYKVKDENAWIDKDVEKNKDKYLAEIKLDKAFENIRKFSHDEYNHYFSQFAKFLNEEDFIVIDENNYCIKNMFGEFITTNAKETLEILEKFEEWFNN
ncbi:MAG: replication initiation protein [Nitrosopumilus sp.]